VAPSAEHVHVMRRKSLRNNESYHGSKETHTGVFFSQTNDSAADTLATIAQSFPFPGHVVCLGVSLVGIQAKGRLRQPKTHVWCYL
jgi:hypothetical protein